MDLLNYYCVQHVFIWFKICFGLRDMVVINFGRKMTDFVKKNRFSIITIMLKQLASDFRETRPDLFIKAHPTQFGVNAALLVIRKGDVCVSFDIRPAGRNQFGVTNGNSYQSQVKITAGNDVAKTKMPPSWTFNLDDPDSITNFERMVLSVIESWIDADSQPQAKAKA